MESIKKRLGRKDVVFPGLTPEDIKEICINNGINDAQGIQEVLKAYKGDLRGLYEIIYTYKLNRAKMPQNEN